MTEKPSSGLTGPRFDQPVERRDFFGLAAVWAFFGTIAAATLGALKLPMPAVFPETDSRFPIGKPEDFPPGVLKHDARRRLYVLSDEKGIAVVSTVCPHLGCVVARADDGTFTCPCHGSEFDATGKVTGGPSPRGLVWYEVSLGPDGRLIVDSKREVSATTRFAV
ncbi:MAG: ubiquinol-cytochrome c reductase iron-sulfur subunit [Phycisphaerae bacterium]